jgi:hypothetical protein
LRTLLGFLIAASFIFFAFRGISFTLLWHDALQANFFILIVTVVVVIFSHFLRALRWRVILQEIKKDVSVVDTWGSIMVGYLLNNFVPRLGEFVRAYTTGKIEGTSVSGVLGTIVLERLFDMLSAGILFGIALATYRESIIGAFPLLQVIGAVLVAGSIAIGAVLYVAATVEKANELLMRFAKAIVPKRFASKVEQIIGSFLSSFSILRSPRSLSRVLLYTTLIWLVYVFTIYIPFFAFRSTTALTFYDSFVLAMVTTVAWTLPSPGGLGVYHLFVSQTLIRFFGVVPDEALAYATLTHLFGYVAITVVGTIFAFIFTQRLKIRSVGSFLGAKDEDG